jgi:hypothetical protein
LELFIEKLKSFGIRNIENINIYSIIEKINTVFSENIVRIGLEYELPKEFLEKLKEKKINFISFINIKKNAILHQLN